MSQEEKSRPILLHGNFKNLKKEKQFYIKCFKKIRNERILLNLFYEVKLTIISKSDEDIRESIPIDQYTL